MSVKTDLIYHNRSRPLIWIMVAHMDQPSDPDISDLIIRLQKRLRLRKMPFERY